MKIEKYLSKITQDEVENREILHITANEAQMSETARRFLGSKLSERYFVGAGENGVVDGNPMMMGTPHIAELVTAAAEAAKEMLHAEIVNLNPLSGVHAMMCSILSTTQPGDTVMTVRHEDGGHFATKGILERVGRKQIFAEYDLEKLKFDAEKLAKRFHEARARAFYMDVSYYVNPHNLVEIRKALGPEAIIIYDASHTMGLIMGQTFQAPLLEGADVISANTHKTLPGPQKGMIAFKNKELGEKANAIIDGCLYSSDHTHHMIALSTTILEMKQFGQAYARQIVANSNAIGQAFSDLGHEVRRANTGRFSENHQVHVFIDKLGDRIELFKKLLRNNISTNFDEPLGMRWYIRVGTQEITRRGMKESDMKVIASLIDRALKDENVKQEVIDFNNKFTTIHYSFDQNE